MPGYHHGTRVIEVTDGARPIKTAETGVIGVVVTAPDAQPAIAAAATIGAVLSNNAIALTAATPGAAGNSIGVTVVDPAAVSQAIDVAVSGNDITVSLATDAAGEAISTADDVILAINTDPEASALVTAADAVGSDGTGLMTAVAKTLLAGGVDEPFPLNTPVLIAGSRTKAAQLDIAGAGRGTAKKVMDAIFKQIAPVVVVVRVAEGASAAETTTNVIGGVDGATGQHSGLQALLVAKSKLGVKPRILGAPGLDTAAVASELVTIADKLRAFTYLGATTGGAATAEEAVTYRNTFGSRRAMVIWPDFTTWNTATSSNDTVWASAVALGLRAKIDNDLGWHKTLSNVAVNGVTGLSADVPWDLQDPNTLAGYLNANEVTTLINEQGFRFWGSRTCSADPNFAFESAARTDDVLADTLGDAHLWAIDKPMSKTLIDDILEGANAKFRELKSLGYIVDAEAFLDPEKNDEDTLAAGQLNANYDYTPVPPLENLNFYSRITSDYLIQLLK